MSFQKSTNTQTPKHILRPLLKSFSFGRNFDFVEFKTMKKEFADLGRYKVAYVTKTKMIG